MRKIVFGFILVFVGFLVYFIATNSISIQIGNNKSELDSEINVVKNSPLKTLHYFSRFDTIESYQAKILVLNFWSPFCGPCVKEVKNLNSLKSNYINNNKVAFWAYRPEINFQLSSKNTLAKINNFKFKHVKFGSGVQKSMARVAARQGFNADTLNSSIPRTYVIEIPKDTILYYKNGFISESEMLEIKKRIDFNLK